MHKAQIVIPCGPMDENMKKMKAFCLVVQRMTSHFLTNIDKIDHQSRNKISYMDKNIKIS